MGVDGDDDTSVAILPHESERRFVIRRELRSDFVAQSLSLSLSLSLIHTHK